MRKIELKGFDVGTSSIDFQVDIAISDRHRNDSIGEERLELGPSDPIKRNANNTVEAELLGDLAGYTTPPTLKQDSIYVSLFRNLRCFSSL